MVRLFFLDSLQPVTMITSYNIIVVCLISNSYFCVLINVIFFVPIVEEY